MSSSKRLAQWAGRVATIVLALLVSTTGTVAQTASAAADAQALQAQANAQALRQDFDKADESWSRAAALLAGLEDWERLGDVHGERALSAFNRGRQADAERGWLAALAAYEGAGSRAAQARTVRNLSFLWRLTPAEKLALARRAVDLAEHAGDPLAEGAARHNWSDHLYGAGDIATASQQLALAIALLERGPESRNLARALTSAGRLHRVLGRPAESVALNTSSARVLERLGDLDGAAQALDAVTVALRAFSAADEVVAASGAALAMARRSGKPVPLVRALCRMADVLAEVGRGTEALSLLDEAAPLVPGVKMSAVYQQARSAVLASLGRMVEALRAIEAVPERAATEEAIWTGYRHAALLRRAGQADAARAVLVKAAAQLDEVSARLVPDDASKRGYFDRVGGLVDLHVRVLADLGDAEGALQASERGRARAFQDLVLSRALDVFSPGQRSTTMAAQAPLVVGLSRSRPAEARAPDAQPGPTGPLPAMTIEDLLVYRGATSVGSAPETPSAIPSGASARVASLDEVRQAAAALQSHLLVYWVGQEDTLIWVVAPTGRVTLARSPVGSSHLEDLRRRAAGPAGQTVRGPAGLAFDAGSRTALRRLYDVLIEPARAALPASVAARVTIVPHGPLVGVSFAGLPNRQGRYLLEDYRLHYAPSIGVLTGAPNRPRGDGPVLLVVDPAPAAPRAGQSSPTLPRLPAAAAEGRAIARVLRGHDVEVLDGGNASEARVRQALPRASVVHFATHGVVSDAAPWTSYLALAKTSIAPDGDGHLSAGELYDLRLDADLVMLGACRTATGPDSSDGVTGLARAFLASGVPTVVASLWDLPDATTARMQPAFYRRWAAQAPPSDALRGAQLDLLRDLRAGRVSVATPVGKLTIAEHPSLWAGLIAIGAP